jgi:probable rRNA maturation factor
MLRALDLSKAELSVMLCDDSTIQELNRRYRQEDHPTDVLAFSMADGEQIAGSSLLLGDVVISLSTAGRQATANKQELLVEVTLLLAHGLLHLLGFDHRTRVQQRRMNARVDMLLAAAIGK